MALAGLEILVFLQNEILKVLLKNMYLHHIEKSIILGPKFELKEFPELMKKHMKEFAGVYELENEAISLVNKNFKVTDLEHFIRHVCRWGNFAGVAGRVVKRNTPDKISRAFCKAYDFLDCTTPCPSSALASLNELNGLGTPSFASKHLRFLMPSLCPVYDAILTDRLPYSFDPEGYEKFSIDCRVIAGSLNKEKIKNPFRENNLWLAADVEASIFALFY